MSTSSWRTVKRRVSSFARSSTSPTSRSSRIASAEITSSEAVRSAGSSTTPSRSASTCPRIAVSGVRSSCETVIRKLRSSSSASDKRDVIWRNESARSATSSPLVSTRNLGVVVALGHLVRGSASRRSGRVMRPERYQARTAVTKTPTSRASPSRKISRVT